LLQQLLSVLAQHSPVASQQGPLQQSLAQQDFVSGGQHLLLQQILVPLGQHRLSQHLVSQHLPSSQMSAVHFPSQHFSPPVQHLPSQQSLQHFPLHHLPPGQHIPSWQSPGQHEQSQHVPSQHSSLHPLQQSPVIEYGGQLQPQPDADSPMPGSVVMREPSELTWPEATISNREVA